MITVDKFFKITPAYYNNSNRTQRLWEDKSKAVFGNRSLLEG